MDRVLVRLMLMSELQIIAIVLAVFFAGALFAAITSDVTRSLRRVLYILLVVLLGLTVSTANLGWVVLPYVADAGYLSILGFGMLAVYALSGAGHYLLAAARSNHICGSRRKAWMAFIPIANLVLAFSRGEHHWDEESGRPRLHFLADAGLVAMALVLFVGTKVLDGYVEDWEYAPDVRSATLSRLISEAQTLEESFSWEAENSNASLPLRLDEITVLSRLEADGATLRIILIVDGEQPMLLGGVREALVQEACAPDMFSYDIGRGGRVVYRYQRLNGEVLAEFSITRTDCFL